MQATGARQNKNSPPSVGWQLALKSTPWPNIRKSSARRLTKHDSSGVASGCRDFAWTKNASFATPTCTKSSQASSRLYHFGSLLSATKGKSLLVARITCTCCVAPMDAATIGFCPVSWRLSPGSAMWVPPSGHKTTASRTIFSMSVTAWFGSFPASSTQSSVPNSYISVPGRQSGLSAQPPEHWPRPCSSPYAKTFLRKRLCSVDPSGRNVTR
mmetsp:Transcript_119803/g.339552  ORF Transcript_119803/g.339552 Transcript_119803/m.339552 type:complete len:213 (-) Transcript_119803:3274-3912(-)